MDLTGIIGRIKLARDELARNALLFAGPSVSTDTLEILAGKYQGLEMALGIIEGALDEDEGGESISQ